MGAMVLARGGGSSGGRGGSKRSGALHDFTYTRPDNIDIKTGTSGVPVKLKANFAKSALSPLLPSSPSPLTPPSPFQGDEVAQLRRLQQRPHLPVPCLLRPPGSLPSPPPSLHPSSARPALTGGQQEDEDDDAVVGGEGHRRREPAHLRRDDPLPPARPHLQQALPQAPQHRRAGPSPLPSLPSPLFR